MRGWRDPVRILLILAPFAGLALGFGAGTIRHPLIRGAAIAIVVALPLIVFFGAGLVAEPSPTADFARGFGLVLFSIPIALWTIFSALGVVVGWAKGQGKADFSGHDPGTS